MEVITAKMGVIRGHQASLDFFGGQNGSCPGAGADNPRYAAVEAFIVARPKELKLEASYRKQHALKGSFQILNVRVSSS